MKEIKLFQSEILSHHYFINDEGNIDKFYKEYKDNYSYKENIVNNNIIHGITKIVQSYEYVYDTAISSLYTYNKNIIHGLCITFYYNMDDRDFIRI